MTIKELKACASGEAPLPTQRVNVRVDADAAPLLRRLTRVEFRRYESQTWLYWFWVPEEPKGNEDLNGLDCGYSGRRVEVV